MAWLLASPGHQRPWYWLCKIGKSCCYMRKDFYGMSVWRNDVKCKYMFMFPLKKISTQRVNWTLLNTCMNFFMYMCNSFSPHYRMYDNGLAPNRRQAITWTNSGILLIGTPGTNFNAILIEIHVFSFKNSLNSKHLKMASGKWHKFCLGHNVLTIFYLFVHVSSWYATNAQSIELHWFCQVAIIVTQILTHWNWKKMAIILQTTFSYAFAWLSIRAFWFKFPWIS